MAIAQDWYVDYYNKVISHASFWIYYTLGSGTFTEGETVTFDAAGTPYYGIVVSDQTTQGAGTSRRMSIVYLSAAAAAKSSPGANTMLGQSSGATGTVVTYNTHSYGMTKWDITYSTLSGTFTTGVATIDSNECWIDVDDGVDEMTVSYYNSTSDPSGTISQTGSGASATVSTAYQYKSTVTTRALYSHLQDTFDELIQLDDTVPMSAQTPTEFTLINAWFIDDESVKYLAGGALKTSGYDGEIQLVTLQAGATDAINLDIGKLVTDDAGDTGNLLHFNNTTRKWWVRWDTVIAASSVMAITSGTGAGTAIATDSTSGEDTYTNIYTLGTIATDPKPETYIFQNSSKITSWWGRGNTTAHVDVLVKVYEMDDGSTDDGIIGDGTITVFARNFADLYDHFNIDLSTGGRKAVPLASATDLNNNATGEGYLLYDVAGGTDFAQNLILTGSSSGATAEIINDPTTATYDWGNEGLLILGHVKGTFTDGEIVYDSSTGSATANGTIGYSYITYSGESGGPFVTGETITGSTTSAAGTLSGLQDDTGTGKLVIEPTNYLDYDAAETISGGTSSAEATVVADATRSVVAYDDIEIWFVNESITTAAISADFTQGEIITTPASDGTATGIFLSTTATTGATGTMYIANVTVSSFGNSETITGSSSSSTAVASADAISTYIISESFTQGTPRPYSVIIDCAGRYMSEVYEWLKYTTREDANTTDQTNAISMYPVVSGAVVTEDGEEYIKAQTSYSLVKASPFGTFAGGKFFAAQGVWVQNMHSDDIQAFQLIDDGGTTRTPPNFQTITISNLVSSDRVLVARTSSGTTINKAVFSLSSAAISSPTLVVDSPTDGIPSDTPDSGYIRVVDVSDTSINREQRYAYSTWTGSTFTLSSSTTRAYTTSDTAYVPYIDATASTTSETATVIYSTDRTVVARIRRYNSTTDSILPFETTGTFNSTGYSAVTIRTPDTIVT